jgi:CO dehydrogenase/acetyl-CoA synthase delta subunit
MTVHQHLK